MKLHLDAKTIYEKEFKSGLRGYNPDDVDNFLDKIIEDYRQFEAMRDTMMSLEAENRRLQEEAMRMRNELDRAKSQQGITRKPIPQPAPTGTTNFDILQRLSNLEKHVFGSKLDRE